MFTQRFARNRITLVFPLILTLIITLPTHAQQAPGQPVVVDEPLMAPTALTSLSTFWGVGGNTPPRITLGEGWVEDGQVLECVGGQDGGTSHLTLPDAPNGVFELWLRVSCQPNFKSDAHARFELDGQLCDFVPPQNLGYQWVFIKTIEITDNSFAFSISDLPNGGVRLRAVRIVAPPTVNVTPTVCEVFDWMTFAVDGFGDYKWDCGDGAFYVGPSCQHAYQTMGTYTATLYRVLPGQEQVVTTVMVNAEPAMSQLIGLSDVTDYGFYSAGFKPNPAQKQEITDFNHQRMRELQQLGITAAYLEFWPWWYNSDDDQIAYHQFLDELHAHGIRAIVSMFTRRDWFANDDSNDMSVWVFDATEALAKFQATDRDGDGISDLDGRIDVLYLAHEVHEYATHDERVQMYQVAKSYFPNTAILVYYGGSLALPYQTPDDRHRAGGLWRDYQFGPGETDIVHLGAGRPFVFDAAGNRQYSIQYTLDKILEQKQHVEEQAPDTPIWVHASFIGSAETDSPEQMWKPEEITGWAKTVLAIGDIQGIFFRSYGRFTYDLGYGVNTADPSQPETGFIEQREAVRLIAQWLGFGGGI